MPTTVKTSLTDRDISGNLDKLVKLLQAIQIGVDYGDEVITINKLAATLNRKE